MVDVNEYEGELVAPVPMVKIMVDNDKVNVAFINSLF
jgi:hypothetical protein